MAQVDLDPLLALGAIWKVCRLIGPLEADSVRGEDDADWCMSCPLGGDEDGKGAGLPWKRGTFRWRNRSWWKVRMWAWEVRALLGSVSRGVLAREGRMRRGRSVFMESLRLLFIPPQSYTENVSYQSIR